MKNLNIQHTLPPNLYVVTYLGICGVGGTETFVMMFHDGPEWIISCFIQSSLNM